MGRKCIVFYYSDVNPRELIVLCKATKATLYSILGSTRGTNIHSVQRTNKAAVGHVMAYHLGNCWKNDFHYQMKSLFNYILFMIVLCIATLTPNMPALRLSLLLAWICWSSNCWVTHVTSLYAKDITVWAFTVLVIVEGGHLILPLTFVYTSVVFKYSFAWTFPNAFCCNSSFLHWSVLQYLSRSDPIANKSSLVHVMLWRRKCDKPLSEPLISFILTCICFTRRQYVKRWIERNEYSWVLCYMFIVLVSN